MKIVIIDNYDSFTYNLSHLIKELGAEVTVYRNDQFELPQLQQFSKTHNPAIRQELLQYFGNTYYFEYFFLKDITYY